MKLRMMALLMGVFVMFSVQAYDKVVYGDDDRLDIFEVQNAMHLLLAKSTAAMISKSNLKDRGDKVGISGSSLQSRGICASAKYAKQITAANCSGFLVGKKLLVTAGHCVTSAASCNNFRWVFDFNLNTEKQMDFAVSKDSVYSCKKVLSQTLNRSTLDDYALIELDREVTDREPLEVRTEGRVASREALLVIGHPTGLPTKVADGAMVRKNNNPFFFQANLDTFAGNSGSAVFSDETGLIEGILVRGETDYVYNRTLGCKVPKVCSNTGCRGEDVTRITNIKALMDILAQN